MSNRPAPKLARQRSGPTSVGVPCQSTGSETALFYFIFLERSEYRVKSTGSETTTPESGRDRAARVEAYVGKTRLPRSPTLAKAALAWISGGVNSAAGPRTCGTLYHARSQLGSAIGMTIAPSAWARRAAFPGAPKPLWYNGRRGRFAAWAAPPFRRSGHGRKFHRRRMQHASGCYRDNRACAREEGMTANCDFRHKRSRDTLESSPALTM